MLRVLTLSPRLTSISMVSHAIVLAVALVSGCASEEVPVPPTDAVTSATPGVPSAFVGESHTGWGQTDCVSCHGWIHDSGYRLPDCTGCHGLNGSPLRQDDHPMDSFCDSCHADVHQELHFQVPSDCRRCHGFRQESDECAYSEEHDVVVIGAGGGGLSAATTLALAGVDVVLLERHYKVGGMMVTFDRGRYTFEASLHGFDGIDPDVGMNVEMFRRLDIYDRLRPVRIDPMYRAVFPDHELPIPADIDEYRELLQAEFPDEADGIEALFAEMETRMAALQAGMGMFNGEELPEDVDVAELIELQEMMDVTLTDFMREYIQDERLISIFTQLCGFTGTEASRLSAVFFMALWNGYHNGGYYYFEGGSQSIADAMAEVIVENGGRIELNTEAVEIDIEDGRATRVRAQDGRCFEADWIISNAPAPITLFELVGREHLAPETVESVEAMQAGASTFVIFLGVDRDYSEYFGNTHELMTSPSYSEAEVMGAVTSCDPANMGMGITNYSMVDPSASPAGTNVITITLLYPYECHDEWGFNTSREAYLQQKEIAAEIVLEQVERYLPDLRSHIEVMETATPHTIRGFTLATRGSIVGWDNTIEQSLMSRLPRQTDIENLLLAGAWTFPGGGQSAVMMSGQYAANDVINDLL